MKTCPKCGRTLPESEFALDKSKKDGLSSVCRDCMFEYYKKKRPQARQMGRRKELPTRDVLQTLYIDDGHTIGDIAGTYNVSHTTILKLMRRYGIKARRPRESAKLSEEHGRIEPLMGRKMPEDIAERYRENLKKANAIRWANGRQPHQNHGYIYVPISNGKSRPMHDIVAEKMIGRPLCKGECVHHINGVKDDNRPENLAVMTYSEHGKLHSRKTIASGKHHLVKLTIEQVIEIRNSNERGVDLARKFNISPNTVVSIRKGRTWKDI